MDKIRPFIAIPVVLVFLIWGSTQAFHLLSEANDWDVIAGVGLLILLAAVLYKFILYLINKPI